MSTATRQQTLAAICDTCPHHISGHERSARLRTDRRLALCEVSSGPARVPIPVRLTMGGCPIGKFPRPETITLADGMVREKSGCGCGNTGESNPAQPVATGASIVYWPRSAQQRVMWRMDERTKRPRASLVWAPWLYGAAWYGLPMPLRWWIMLRYGIVQQYEGCGCLVSLKRLAPWLDGPLTLLERLRLAVVAPAAVWWHSRHVWQERPWGRVQVENPAWNPLPGVPAKAGAWVVAAVMVIAAAGLAMLGR